MSTKITILGYFLGRLLALLTAMLVRSRENGRGVQAGDLRVKH